VKLSRRAWVVIVALVLLVARRGWHSTSARVSRHEFRRDAATAAGPGSIILFLDSTLSAARRP